MGSGIKTKNNISQFQDKTDWVEYNGIYMSKMEAAGKKAWATRMAKKNIDSISNKVNGCSLINKVVDLYFCFPHYCGNSKEEGVLVSIDNNWVVYLKENGEKHFVPTFRLIEIIGRDKV